MFLPVSNQYTGLTLPLSVTSLPERGGVDLGVGLFNQSPNLCDPAIARSWPSDKSWCV